MSTLVTIQSTDLITNSRADVNNNFALLNSEKLETSVLSTDTTLSDNSDSKVATQKAVKSYIDANAVPNTVSSETTTGTTHSLTTIADQKVIVWASGAVLFNGITTAITLSLKYNGVTKHTYSIDTGTANEIYSFSLMYTETPGAATANITVEAGDSSPDLSGVVIMVLKL